MIRYFVIFFSLLVPIIASGSELADYFSQLENIDIKHAAFDASSFHYNPQSSQVLNDINEQLSKEYGFDVINVAKVTLLDKPEDSYLITYDEGLPAGPNFKFFTTDGGDRKLIGSIPGINLYWQGRRVFYTSGHINSMYNRKRKYRLKDNKITEVVQPFRYVGLESELKESIILYASKTSERPEEIVGRLPKDAQITVLLEDNDYYLLKTSFGLTGWTQIDKNREDTIIKGLYYRGADWQ